MMNYVNWLFFLSFFILASAYWNACPQDFPPTSELDPKMYGNQNSTIREDDIEKNMNGLTADQVLLMLCIFPHYYQHIKPIWQLIFISLVTGNRKKQAVCIRSSWCIDAIPDKNKLNDHKDLCHENSPSTSRWWDLEATGNWVKLATCTRGESWCC